MKTDAPIILASSSPWRRALLKNMGLTFTAHAADIDERPLPKEPPEKYVRRLACRKAQTVAAETAHPAWIIGADQVAVCAGRLWGKPGTAVAARQQLRFFSGRSVRFLTGLCLLQPDGRRRSRLVEAGVTYRRLTAKDIKSYLEREPEAIHCAAAMKSEGAGVALLRHMYSDDPGALIGMPVLHLCSMFAAAGFPLLQAARPARHG